MNTLSFPTFKPCNILTLVCFFSCLSLIGHTGEIVRLAGQEDLILKLAWSPNGQELVTLESNNTVKRWDLDSGKPVWSFRNYGELEAIALFPNGKRLLLGGQNVSLVDFQTGKTLNSWRTKLDKGWHTRLQVSQLAIQGDGKRFAMSGVVMGSPGYCTGQEWTTAGKVLSDLEGPVISVAYDPKRRFLAYGPPATQAHERACTTIRPAGPGCP